MASLFCVLVCVPAQPTLSTVHTAAAAISKIYFNGFISGNLIVANNVFSKASESDASGDLRAVHDRVETETVLLKVTTERPITNLSKDGMR